MEENKIFRKQLDAFSETHFQNVRRWLKNAERKKEGVDGYVMETPPILPAGGSVILFRKTNPSDKSYLCDQYRVMLSKGKMEVGEGTLVKQYYQLHTPASKNKGLVSKPLQFRRHIYALKEPYCPERPVVLLHYIGNEGVFKPSAHGNSVENVPYVRSLPSVRSHLKRRVQDPKSSCKSVYEEMVRLSAKEHTRADGDWKEETAKLGSKGEAAKDVQSTVTPSDPYEPIHTPRNLNQVKNAKAVVARERRLTNCEIYSLYEMAKQDIGTSVLRLDLVPFDVVVLGEPTMLTFTNAVLQVSVKDTTQLDVACAFLNSPLNETVYMEQPEGFQVGGLEYICALSKAIYGLKQGPRFWLMTLKDILAELSLKPISSDTCIFVGMIDGEDVIVGIYVDDGLICSKSDQVIHKVLKLLGSKFEITSCIPKVYIGMEINHDRENGIIQITQVKYIQRLLERFGMQDCKPASTPMDNNLDIPRAEVPDTQYPYRELIGGLLFLARVSRFDISYSVSRLSQYCTSYNKTHWSLALRILRYLKSTMNFGFRYQPHPDFELVGFSDADYSTCKLDRRSISGFIFLLGNCPITWSSRKQNAVSLSSCESEYYALSEATKEVIWIRNLLLEIGVNFTQPTTIHVDNQSTIKLAHSNLFHSRTKHLAVKLQYVREQIENEVLAVKYVPTALNLADPCTKSLQKTKFETLRNSTGLVPCADNDQKLKNTGNRFNLPANSLLHVLMYMFLLLTLATTISLPEGPKLIWRKLPNPVISGSFILL